MLRRTAIDASHTSLFLAMTEEETVPERMGRHTTRFEVLPKR